MPHAIFHETDDSSSPQITQKNPAIPITRRSYKLISPEKQIKRHRAKDSSPSSARKNTISRRAEKRKKAGERAGWKRGCIPYLHCIEVVHGVRGPVSMHLVRIVSISIPPSGARRARPRPRGPYPIRSSSGSPITTATLGSRRSPLETP